MLEPSTSAAKRTQGNSLSHLILTKQKRMSLKVLAFRSQTRSSTPNGTNFAKSTWEGVLRKKRMMMTWMMMKRTMKTTKMNMSAVLTSELFYMAKYWIDFDCFELNQPEKLLFYLLKYWLEIIDHSFVAHIVL